MNFKKESGGSQIPDSFFCEANHPNNNLIAFVNSSHYLIPNNIAEYSLTIH